MNTAVNAEVGIQTVPVWNGQINLCVRLAGRPGNPPLVYLHPAGGLLWDGFLDRLAEHYHVFAPEFPGTSVGDPYALRELHHWQEVLLVYEELLRGLAQQFGWTAKPVLAGQSFGGMLAADLAATFPELPARLVLLDAIGLWRDDAPVVNWNELPASELPALLFHDPQCAAAQAMLALPDDPQERIKSMAQGVWTLGCTGKFVWPIPDLGLSRRLYRISVPALIVWGAYDRLVSPVYAQEYARLIADSRAVIIPGVGHIPQVENLEATWAAVAPFLQEGILPTGQWAA